MAVHPVKVREIFNKRSDNRAPEHNIDPEIA
jgi:hypothetical protein